MTNRILILSIASTLFFACKSNKDTAAVADSTATTQSQTAAQSQTAEVNSKPEAVPVNTDPDILVLNGDSLKEDKYRLIVVFFSIGSGTDNKAMTTFEDFISAYAGKAGKNIDYERTPWGREGETDYCLRLNELDAKGQADFVKQTTESLKSAKWVHIYENQACKHKRNR